MKRLPLDRFLLPLRFSWLNVLTRDGCVGYYALTLYYQAKASIASTFTIVTAIDEPSMYLARRGKRDRE